MRAVSDSARKSNLQLYLTEINATHLLSAAEEHDLGTRVAEGDPEARNHLIQANLRLVVRIARAYQNRGLSLEDLIAEGNLGLMRSVETFDVAARVRFSTYASFWIKQSLRIAVIRHGKPIRLPSYVNNELIKWRRATASLCCELKRDPTVEEVAHFLKLSRKRLRVVIQALRILEVMSHPQEFLNSRDEPEQSEHLADVRARPAVEQLIERDEHYKLHRMIDHLEERESAILQMRYGLGDTTMPMTLDEVGRTMGGYTRERIRQLEKQAIAKLRLTVA